MPIFNNNGEFQGILMVIKDVTDMVIVQSELRKKDEELGRLDSKLKEEKLKELEHIDNLVEKKQRELESLSGSIALKTEELDGVSIKLQENKSALELTENKLAKKVELESATPSQEGFTENWNEKLKLYDEIDKFLGINDDSLKTKKIDHEIDIQED
jgi:hypothetical protein